MVKCWRNTWSFKTYWYCLLGDIISKFLPYGKQTIDDEDINEVVKTLNSDFITQGPKIEEHSFTASITSSGYVNTSLYLKTNQEVQYKIEYVASISGNQKGQANDTLTVTSTGVTTNNSFKLESGSPVGTYKVYVIIKDMNNNVG